MAALVEQKEAARLLGVSEDELKAMISQNELFGYRDGANWKFKMEELDRVADERGVVLGAEPSVAAGSGIDDDLEELVPVEDVTAEDEGESILVSEEELGQSGIGTASTIIGREDLDAGESDVRLASDSTPSPDASDVLLSTRGESLLGDSVAGSSDVIEEPASGESSGDSTNVGLEDDALDDDALEAGLADSGKLEIEESLLIADEFDANDSLALGEDDDADSLALDDAWDDESPTQLGSLDDSESDDDLVLDGGGSLNLKFDDDGGSALALGEDDSIGSSIGSDVTLGSGDSGIGLSNPTDSGLSLEEEPIELGGSQVGAMALGEDDMIELEEEGDSEAATELRADGDFLLTPVDDDVEEESDSGSQVIALDAEQFDDSADTMLAAGPAVLEEDDFAAAPADAALMGGVPGGAYAGQPMMHPAAQLPEAKYSIWNVLSLMLVFSLMALTGMLMVDVVRNMWQYDAPLSASGPVMEFVLSILPK